MHSGRTLAPRMVTRCPCEHGAPYFNTERIERGEMSDSKEEQNFRYDCVELAWLVQQYFDKGLLVDQSSDRRVLIEAVERCRRSRIRLQERRELEAKLASIDYGHNGGG